MGDEERDLEAKVKHLQDLLKFIIAFTDNNGKHQKDVEQHGEGKTRQKQKKTVRSPFSAEATGTEQHQSTLNGKKTVEKVYVYVGPSEDMYTMPYMRELGCYLGETGL